MDVVDAFCGAGGFSAGAMAVGCRCKTRLEKGATRVATRAFVMPGRSTGVASMSTM